jgi:HK97 family phage major capsid protein
MKYSEMLAKLKADNARIVEIDGLAETTEELKAEQDTLIAACEDMKGKIERKKASIEIDGYVADAEANPPLEARVIIPQAIVPNTPTPKYDATVVPVKATRLYGSITSFAGPDKEIKAYRFGQWFMATAGVQSSIDYCNNTGMPMAVHNEGTNTAGGYLVPEEFGTDMTRLTLEYGAFRANTNIVPMMSDTRTDPRQTAFMTATWVGESEAATESDMAWDQIRLVAKKLKAVTRITNELSADTAISVGDQVIRDIARAFALAEDTAGYNGTGLSATGGITGVIQSLSDAAGTPTTTSAGGIIVSANNTYAEITLAEFHLVIGTCPTFARRTAKWHASPLFHNTVMMKLQTAAGGNTVSDISNGGLAPFLGYPVVPVEVMPTAAANSQIPALFGDLSQASKLGDRMARTISTSEHATVNGVNVWEVDQLAIKGVERIDINVHDVGSTSVAGPICGLQLLNS